MEGESEERPWEHPGSVRRDCEPHHGPLLSLLGIVCLVCGFLSLCLVFPGLIGLPLAVVVGAVASRDLDKMTEGIMDPQGWEQTERARTWARVSAAVILGTLLIIALVLLLVGSQVVSAAVILGALLTFCLIAYQWAGQWPR